MRNWQNGFESWLLTVFIILCECLLDKPEFKFVFICHIASESAFKRKIIILRKPFLVWSWDWSNIHQRGLNSYLETSNSFYTHTHYTLYRFNRFANFLNIEKAGA